MNVINFTDARNQLKRVFDDVSQNVDYTIIARRDADDVVVLSLDYFNALLETAHLLSSPNNASHLKRSIIQYQNIKPDNDKNTERYE